MDILKKNIYIFMFFITLVSSLVLSVTFTQLNDTINTNIEVDRKKNVLKCIGIETDMMDSDKVIEMYGKLIKESVLNIDGSISDIHINNLKSRENKSTGSTSYYYNDIEYLPLYKSKNKNATILPITGKGLWSTMYGYIAFKEDLNTILGITFYKHGETPGLGAEVDKKWFQDNFKNKLIFDEENNFVSIEVKKGKAGDSQHCVDGISGATMTSNGVTKMLNYDIGKYLSYIKSFKVSQ